MSKYQGLILGVPRLDPSGLGKERCGNFGRGSPTMYIYIYMGVSENRGTPKSSILMEVSTINHPFFGVTLFLETPKDTYDVLGTKLIPYQGTFQDDFISWELASTTSTFQSMIFRFSRWDMLVPWSCNDAGRALAATAVAAASLRMTKQLLELRKCLKQIQLLGSLTTMEKTVIPPTTKLLCSWR